MIDLNLIEANVEKFERLIERFLSLSTPEIKEPTKLVELLAKRARLLRDAILENLDENEGIKALYEAFKEHLISDMKKEFDYVIDLCTKLLLKYELL